MTTPRKQRSLDTLWRAFLFRHMPFLFEINESLGVDDETPVLANRGIEQTPIKVLGRLYHALQIHGLSTADGESWQLAASLDGTAFANIGSAIVADGFIQVTTGLYGYLRTRQTVAINAFTIQYVGAGTVATVTIRDNHLILTVDGTVEFNLDLTVAAYDTYVELVAYIQGLADYTATIDTAGTTDATTSLTEVDVQDIATAPLQLNRGATILLGSMH